MQHRAIIWARRGLTKMPCRTRRSSRRTVPKTSAVSILCARSAVSIRACLAACTCIWGMAKCWRPAIRLCSEYRAEGMEGIQRIEALIQQIESLADPETRSTVRELISAILEYHGEGLA